MRKHVAVGGLLVAAALPWAAREVFAGDGATTAEIADLVDELRDPEAHVREVARKRLVALGDKAVPALVELLRRDEPRGRVEAVATLGAMGPAAKAAAPVLAESARTEIGRARLPFVEALARIDAAGAADTAVPMLLAFLDDDPSLRLEAAKTLRVFGPAAAKFAPDVLAKLGGVDPATRAALLDAVKSMGVDAAQELVDLFALRTEKDRSWIAAAVSEMGDAIVPAAVERLASEDKNVRAAAAQVLGIVGAPAKSATTSLVEALKDPAGVVRRRAAEALGLVGADAKVALPALADVVRDANSRAQIEAITAIARIVVGNTEPPPGPAAPEVEKAVGLGLDWLKRHQSADGRWDCAGFVEQCKDARCGDPGEVFYAPGVTGLATLAFLGAGQTHQAGPFSETVKRGLLYLRGIQDSDGCIGPRTSQHFLYDHAVGALAMTEAFKRTRSTVFKEAAQRAVAFVMRAKNPYLGWRYNVPPDGDNDTSSTGWMTEIVKSAADAGLDVDRAALKDAVSWVDKMTEPEFGRTGYQQRGGPPARTNEMMAKFPAQMSESLTAEALVVRLAAGHDAKSDPLLGKSAELVAARPPRWSEGAVDFYYWRFGAEAMHRIGGPNWDSWRQSLVSALTAHQCPKSAGCANGSWDAADPWGSEGGRVYSTSMALLALEECGGFGGPPAKASRPRTDEVRSAIGALLPAEDSDDKEVRQAAKAAVDAINAVYARDEIQKGPK